MPRFRVEIPAGRDPRVWMDGDEVSSVCRSMTLFPGRCAIAVLLYAIEPRSGLRKPYLAADGETVVTETIEGELED